MEEPRFIKGQLDEVIHRPNGKVDAIARVQTGGGVSEEQVKEVLSEVYGVSKENVHKLKRARKRGSVVFSGKKWNSSWVPDGANPEQIDPTQN